MSVLKGVDQRTNLVGQNRLELLLFYLHNKQKFGINVFKIREVITCPPLTRVPHASGAVRGMTKLRGSTFLVIDLQQAIGLPPLENIENCSVIITEFNRNVQGFLVSGVEHIVNLHWEDVRPLSKATGNNHYLTAVAEVDKELVEILDVEKVLYEVTGGSIGIGDKSESGNIVGNDVKKLCHVLIADDSSVARNQIKRTLGRVGVDITTCEDGRKALDQLQTWRDNDPEKLRTLALVISDVEMPEMDGYTLTSEIRNDAALRHLKVLLHTSLSGVFDSSLLERVEADDFLSKFDSDQLGGLVERSIQEWYENYQKS
ncbi:MAG: chemotaxis protein [Gammaproteobacteria bacterium]|nr:chemotaxis protein [Gammaproteobacteria bacterium]